MQDPEVRIAEIKRIKAAMLPGAWAALRVQAPRYLGGLNDNGLTPGTLAGTAVARDAIFAAAGLAPSGDRPGGQGSAAEAALLEIVADWCARGILRPRHLAHFDPWDNAYYVTTYGYTCASSDDPDNVPDDPIGYLTVIEGRTGALDVILRQYLVESLSSFGARTYLASLVMLGCAAERLLHQLNEALPVPHDAKPGKLIGLVLKDLEVELKTKGTQLHPTDQQHWKVRLEAGLGIVRASRNEAGHPELVRPVDRFDVRERFLLFSTCVETAYAILKVL